MSRNAGSTTCFYINKSKINIHAHRYHALLLSYNLALLQFKNTFQNLSVFRAHPVVMILESVFNISNI